MDGSPGIDEYIEGKSFKRIFVYVLSSSSSKLKSLNLTTNT